MATAVHAEQPCASYKWPTREEIEESVRAARRAMTSARNTAETLATDAVAEVRRHPLRAIGAAMIGGAVVGSAAGFFAGFFMRPRRRRWEW
jgi:hypothetical protein